MEATCLWRMIGQSSKGPCTWAMRLRHRASPRTDHLTAASTESSAATRSRLTTWPLTDSFCRQAPLSKSVNSIFEQHHQIRFNEVTSSNALSSPASEVPPPPVAGSDPRTCILAKQRKVQEGPWYTTTRSAPFVACLCTASRTPPGHTWQLSVQAGPESQHAHAGTNGAFEHKGTSPTT